MFFVYKIFVLLFPNNVNIEINISGINTLINIFIHIFLYALYLGFIYLVFFVKVDMLYYFLLLHIKIALFIKKQ